MKRPLIYDVTRLVTRIFARTPNGIDRVDFALAEQAFKGDAQRAALIVTPFGPRVISPAAAREALANIRKHWGEDADPERDAAGVEILAWLTGRRPGAKGISVARQGQYRDALAWMGRHGALPGEPARPFLSRGCVYLNASQFPLSVRGALRWLARSPSTHGVFFVHDLLPLETPEFFRPVERARHVNRLRAVAALAHAAIVSSSITRDSLAGYMSGMGRPDLPILVAPLAATPAFTVREEERLSRGPYFVMVGTIEPRKNQLFILQVWRDIAETLGPLAPKLILIGERGWQNEQVTDLIERCEALRGRVLLASGLPTPTLRRLLLGARALLMPSLAEGFGLPVVEALAAGVPIVASDISIFREISGGRLTLIDPIDGAAWRTAILDRWTDRTGATAPANHGCQSWEEAFNKIETFVDRLVEWPRPGFAASRCVPDRAP